MLGIIINIIMLFLIKYAINSISPAPHWSGNRTEHCSIMFPGTIDIAICKNTHAVPF